MNILLHWTLDNHNRPARFTREGITGAFIASPSPIRLPEDPGKFTWFAYPINRRNREKGSSSSKEEAMEQADAALIKLGWKLLSDKHKGML